MQLISSLLWHLIGIQYHFSISHCRNHFRSTNLIWKEMKLNTQHYTGKTRCFAENSSQGDMGHPWPYRKPWGSNSCLLRLNWNRKCDFGWGFLGRSGKGCPGPDFDQVRQHADTKYTKPLHFSCADLRLCHHPGSHSVLATDSDFHILVQLSRKAVCVCVRAHAREHA